MFILNVCLLVFLSHLAPVPTTLTILFISFNNFRLISHFLLISCLKLAFWVDLYCLISLPTLTASHTGKEFLPIFDDAERKGYKTIRGHIISSTQAWYWLILITFDYNFMSFTEGLEKKRFCYSWKQQLIPSLVSSSSVPSDLTIDGVCTVPCSGLLLASDNNRGREKVKIS